MNTLAIKNSIRAIDNASSGNPEIERRIILSLIGLLITLAITYGYFVKQTINNVVLREQTIEKITDFGGDVSTLEVKYIELKNNIGLDLAYSLGYQDISNVKFVSKSLLGKTLTLKHN